MNKFSFKDCLGVDCSIRVADSAEDRILVGCDNADIKKLVAGEGMQPVYIPPPYVANTQMCLNKNMAIKIIETLQAFVDVVEQTPTFDDLETTIIVTEPEASRPPLEIEINDLPGIPIPAESDEPPTIPALEKAKAIKDTQEIIDRLTINKMQEAFIYLLGNLSGICIGNWTKSEAVARAVTRLDLDKNEAKRLRKMYRISTSSGTQR